MRILERICLVAVIMMMFSHVIVQRSFAVNEDNIIESINIEGLSNMEEKEFLDLIGINKGDILKKSVVRAGIKRAFRSGKFNDLIISISDSDSSSMIIQVKERYVVEQILVFGNKGLRRKTIIDQFDIKLYDYFDEGLFGERLAILEDKLKGSGYQNVNIEGKVSVNEDARSVIIELNIDEGEPSTIDEVVIGGLVEKEEVSRATGVLRIFPGDVYDIFYITERMKIMEDIYRNERYYKATVGPFNYTDGVLTVFVNKGKRFDIKFSGNEAINDKRLLDETIYFSSASIEDEIIEESSERIVRLYHEEGYAFAQLAPVITETDDAYVVDHFIFEGAKLFIGDIRISGTSIPAKRLKKAMSLKEGGIFDPDNLPRDSLLIEELYYALGYREVKVNDFNYEINEEKGIVDINIDILEGDQTVVGGVFFKGNKEFNSDELKEIVQVRRSSPYNEISISDSRLAVSTQYKTRGYLDIAVDVERRFREGKVYLKFVINEGVQYRYGFTIVRGNRNVNSRVITRQLMLEKEEPLDLVSLRSNTQRLYRLGLFSDVRSEIIDDELGYKDVLVDVKESNAGAIEIGAGYGDYEKYRGYLDISYRNFFGMNRYGKVRMEIDTLSEKLILGAFEPWLYRFKNVYSPISLGVNLMTERRTEKNIDTGEVRYKVRKHSFNSNIEMSFSENIKGRILYSFSIVDTYEIQPDVVLSKEDTGTLAISKIGPGLIYDTRNDPFNPSSGIFGGLYYEIASRNIGSETEFNKLVINANTYKRLHRKVVAALSLRGGLAQTFGDTSDLPVIERFFLGGRSTVRGYTQDSLGPIGVNGNPVGGSAFVVGNIELRINIWRSVGIVVFLDGGNVWDKESDIDLEEIKYSTGGGLRYNTPVGPVRLDYGYKLNKEVGESDYEIHFSIGHAF